MVESCFFTLRILERLEARAVNLRAEVEFQAVTSSKQLLIMRPMKDGIPMEPELSFKRSASRLSSYQSIAVAW